MPKPLLPLFLDLADQTVLLVGGGTVALAKLQVLHPTGCRLRLVATRCQPGFLAEARALGLTVQVRPFQPEDLAGVVLVVSASNDPAANAAIAALAKARGIWVNAVDDPPSCTALFAATVRRGPWTVALATGGAFAGLSRSLRRALEALIPEQDAGLLEDLVALRARLRQRLPDPGQRSRALRGLLQQFEHTYFGLPKEDPR